MKIGLLGGSFDPPHNGHIYMAKTLLASNYCQKIILVPCLKHPFSKPLSEARHRLAMAKLLMSKNIEVSDIEIKSPAKQNLAPREKVSYSIDTLNSLKNQSTKDEFVWIIGEDQLDNFTKWKNWREIIERFGLIVVPRTTRPPRGSPSVTPEAKWLPTSEVAKQRLRLLGGEVAFAYFKPLDISSSKIRKRVKDDLSIDNLVPKEVERYIIQHKLYL